jgi:hypothetical protein
VSHPPSLSVSGTVRTLLHRIRSKLTRHRHLDAPDDEECLGSIQETPQPLPKSPSPILRDDPHDWGAVAESAIGIRKELLEKASAHAELWERLETLLLNALEQRTADQNQ